MSNPVNCEGACEQHNGEVVLVSVKGWGEFNYCGEAIKEDQRRGLFVALIHEEHNDPWLTCNDIMED